MICFAILAHEKRSCLDELIANVQAFASPCRIVVYNGGSDPHFLDGLDMQKEYGVMVFPKAHPIVYGRQVYLLEVMNWLVEQRVYFDYLINLDSDMLLIKPGLERYLDQTMWQTETKPTEYWGANLSISPIGDSRWSNEAGVAREFDDLWLPLLGDRVIARAFNPGQVLRRAAVEKIYRYLADTRGTPGTPDTQGFAGRQAALARLLARTRAFAVDEVLLPSLAYHSGCACSPWPHSNTRLTLRRFLALTARRRWVHWDMIHDLLAGERGGLRYKEAFTVREVQRFLADDHTFLIHPVRMKLADPVRRLIRAQASAQPGRPVNGNGSRAVSPDVSVIILTWNSMPTIPKCLASLYSQTQGVRFEVIVVDNGSRDGTPSWIRTHYPEVRLIDNATNRGVAPARNQGLRCAQGKACCLLDSDTVLLNDALSTLYRRLWAEPDIGLVAPRLEYRDGTHQANCRRFPTVFTKLARMLGKDAASSGWWGRLLRQEQQIGSEIAVATDVDYAIGACQMFRRCLLDDPVGYLDEHIFYGPEDVDFCLRLWLGGWRVVYEPAARLVHDEQRLTHKKFFSHTTRAHLAGLAYYFWKHRYGFSRQRLYRRIPSHR